MSRGPENTFIASVHRHLPEGLYHMKNHNQYNGGIADVWYSGKRRDLWVEYKYLELPKRASTLIDLVAGRNPPLSHLQQEWLDARSREGRNVWVVVGTKSGGVVYPDRSWNDACTAEEFAQDLKSRKEIAAMIASFVT